MRATLLGFSLLIAALPLVISPAGADAPKLPLRDGQYSFHPCRSPGATDKDGSVGIYVTEGGRQFISPNSEGIDAYCTIAKLRKAGEVFSGVANCERGGMRTKFPIGTYTFHYRVTSPTSFVTNEASYEWCAPHL